MIDVGMGQKYRFNGIGGNRQGDVLKHICALLHAAVYQIIPSAYFQQRAAAGDFMGGADKLNPHNNTSVHCFST